MDAADGRNGQPDNMAGLEESVRKLVDQLNEYRKENELLKSEVESLQNILRSFKLPGTEGAAVDAAGRSGDGIASADRIRIKQKLALLLQKIERELRGARTRF